MADLNVTPKLENKLSSPLLKSRSTRTPKPNSFIFSSDNEVRMPRKNVHSKRNQLIKTSIKTMNKKAKLINLKAKPKNGLNGYSKTNKQILSNAYGLKNGYNGLSDAKSGPTSHAPDNRTPKLTKRRYVKRKPRLDSDQLVHSSSDDTENSSTFASNENKNFTNLNLKNSDINHLFTKQPVTKNGKIRGRPRKPIMIDSILNAFSNGAPGKNGDAGFKHLLERIGESHNQQMNKLRKEMDEKEREKIVLNVKNASLIKENESLRARIANLINESELRKELEEIKRLHSQEIMETKKMRWVSGL